MTADAQQVADQFAFRLPQRQALRKLQATLDAIDLDEALGDVEASLPGTFSFDTAFPSFCFDLATGVGKTKLMAGAITLLQARGLSRNFFILAPGETIYSKLLRELSPGHPDYLFAGIPLMNSATVITGEDYLHREAVQRTAETPTIYLFNIQKLLKGSAGQRYRFHTPWERLGGSFAAEMQAKGDLVVLMDESHRYRGQEYMAAIENLRPRLGLEFTATPAHDGNVLMKYPLKKAISDGWVKKVRPIYRQNDASLDEELDELKLRDGLRVHEATKVELEAYAENEGLDPICPLVLINVESIERAEEIGKRLEDEFGYAGRVLVIHSKNEDDEERQLVALETERTKEIVVHVNKLREGWDVRNIFTIIPLRASISVTLTAQTIGRGVRLPFGVNNRGELELPDVATLNVICYQRGRDNYKLIVEAAKQLGPVEARDASETVEMEKVKVQPVAGSGALVVPSVEAQVSASAHLAPFQPAVNLTEDTAEARLVGVDIAGGSSQDVGAATSSVSDDMTQDLAQRLLDRLPELQPSDAATVIEIVSSYLTTAAGAERDDWETFLRTRRRFAYDDLAQQIKANVQQSSSVSYTVTSSQVIFDDYQTAIPAGSGIRDCRKVPDKEIRTSLIGGYSKSLYEGSRFDSRQEKWLGDALDADADVIEWLKIPEGKLVIRTPLGRYLPDFIARTASQSLLIEVKDSKSVEERNAAVVEKAHRAKQWCKTLNAGGHGPWRYALLRHDRVKQGDSLQGMLAGAVTF